MFLETSTPETELQQFFDFRVNLEEREQPCEASEEGFRTSTQPSVLRKEKDSTRSQQSPE